MVVRVGVVGYGTIGKRVVSAIKLQEDMKLEGIVKRSFNYEMLVAEKEGNPIYTPDENTYKELQDRGVNVRGTLSDLLARVDVVVDATPSGTGALYSSLYKDTGVNVVFQGGEKPDVADISFSSLCNYEEALGKNSVRVVSCNTTGLLRLVCILKNTFQIGSVNALIIRRGADPKDYKRGPINSLVLKPVEPGSHHGRDAMLVERDIMFKTRAVIAPTTLMHIHNIFIRFREKPAKSDIIKVLEEAPRIILLNANQTGITSTGQVIELFRDLNRPRGDIPELIIWEESIDVDGNEVSLIQGVHQESIVVPENIDAIRAITQIERNSRVSIEKTDRSLGLFKKLW